MAETAPPLSPRTDDKARLAPAPTPVAPVPAAPTAAPRRPAPVPDREPLWRHVLGEHLRSLRHERGETLAETAGRAGLSPQYLSEVERGIKEPSSEMIAALGGALDVTLGDLTIAVADILTRARPTGRSAPVCRAAFGLAA
ncbi:helix-turn-helix domain-containing protein [Embleya hyalina]|uniref:Putative transcriptional regulatory protein n=1 Tax=Embleya hyalina TaxID=516124 RepID=A0A401YV96_9ACTN|nr:helix-turn-helix transcriptional regulator [Embleya hyalina]GCD98542.1 putative transcriptional regulatory protein [Embleya hyalina]